VVEYEALIRMISTDILEEAGFRVLESENAAEAIVIMEGADHVELMFTHIRLPGRTDGRAGAGHSLTHIGRMSGCLSRPGCRP